MGGASGDLQHYSSVAHGIVTLFKPRSGGQLPPFEPETSERIRPSSRQVSGRRRASIPPLLPPHLRSQWYRTSKGKVSP